MKAITYDNILSRLLEAVPEFQPDDDDVSENLVYLVFADLMRFVKRELETKHNEQLLQRVFAFFEEATRFRDPRLIDVLRDALYYLAIPDPDTPRRLMGPSTRRLFRKVEKDIYG